MVEPLWVIKLLSFSGTLRELWKPITPSRRPISKKISVIGDFVGCDCFFDFMFPFTCTFFLVSSVFFACSQHNTYTKYLSHLFFYCYGFNHLEFIGQKCFFQAMRFLLAELYASILVYFAISKPLLDGWSDWFSILHGGIGHSGECQHLYSFTNILQNSAHKALKGPT